MFCRYCGAEVQDGVMFCPACGAAQSDAPTAAKGYTTDYAPMPIFPMKWFKFLIYFGLFAGALLNVLNGIMMVTGMQYDMVSSGAAEAVYDEYPHLQTLDISVGVGMFLCAVMGVYARFRLAGYYKDGPKAVNAVYLLGAVLNIAYAVGIHLILPEADITSTFTSFAISMAMVSLNSTYFKKREELFIR